MQLSQGFGYGDPGLDAGQGVSAVAAGKPAACPRCGSRNVVVLYQPPRSAAAG